MIDNISHAGTLPASVDTTIAGGVADGVADTISSIDKAVGSWAVVSCSGFCNFADASVSGDDSRIGIRVSGTFCRGRRPGVGDVVGTGVGVSIALGVASAVETGVGVTVGCGTGV